MERLSRGHFSSRCVFVLSFVVFSVVYLRVLRDGANYCLGFVQIEYPEIEDNAKPRHRFMSSYEQVIFCIF